MKGYLLDTSVCVALFRGNRSVSKKLNEVGKDCCYVNDVVVAELIVGAYKSNRTKENLEQMPILYRMFKSFLLLKQCMFSPKNVCVFGMQDRD